MSSPCLTALEHDGVGVVLPGRPEMVLALVAQARTAQRVLAHAGVVVLAHLVMADGCFCQVEPRLGWTATMVRVGA